jgi:alkylation response protein AidB-like acyl-CoA dehydrogenase
MDFEWNDEQQKFRDGVIEFARRKLATDIAERDRNAAFSRELWQECATFGIQGLPFPEEYGGTNASVLTTVAAMEALGEVCRDAGLLFSIHAQMWGVQMPLLAFGTEDQKHRYLTPLCTGSSIGAHGITEPDAGSDVFSLSTRAERHGDNYVLNGTKVFVTNGPIAEVFLVFATVDQRKGMWGVTGFLLESGTKGLKVSSEIHKMGLTTSPMAELVLEDCVVPANNVLGDEGQGAQIFNHSMGWERSCILASTVGSMERQLQECLEYAKTRRQFNRPIGDFQLVASKIVDMKMRLETSRLLLYRAAVNHDRGAEITTDAALAKLHIGDAAVQSALDAIQIHGAYGYTTEFEVERELRDAIGGRLYSGSSEIQRLLIATELGLSPM